MFISIKLKEHGMQRIIKTQISDIDSAIIMKNVIKELRTGSEYLKQITDSIDLNLLEDLSETYQEAKRKNEEVNVIMSSLLTQEDDLELENELNALINPELLLNKSQDLPETPNNIIIISDQRSISKLSLLAETVILTA
ncbi:hypothetical protein MXB_3213 [Myxobolus squamalis]|nr:hypothetical protein MXB_3213 [Myxobolus squamalis]